uniref:Mitogen-activated protein kinase kinase kinase ANP1 n=1 Tax=Anthurium amnicola TaxID=1678845 RepID=A0A1D1YK31_9ARAE
MKEWVRGAVVGRGSFGTVNLATVVPKQGNPVVMAVKSSPVSDASTLLQEKAVLHHLAGCPEIVSCYGDDLSVEPDGRRLYNLFLEYVPGGPLSELCRGNPMAEGDVRRYAASLLRGLRRVHAAGYVHCDVKPQNVLVAGAGRAKVADFGLARKAGAGGAAPLRGTPLYMAPESVGKGEHEPPSDIWSFGCVVAEMATGEAPWRSRGVSDPAALLFFLGAGEEVPEIPETLSEQGRDFLRRCLVRDPAQRWTAEMLLDHPFLEAHAGCGKDDCSVDTSPDSDHDEDDPRGQLGPTPRSVFGFPTWVSTASPHPSISSSSPASPSPPSSSQDAHLTPADRLRRLGTGPPEPSWDSPVHSSGSGWITVRDEGSPEETTPEEENRGLVQPSEVAAGNTAWVDPVELVLPWPPRRDSGGQCRPHELVSGDGRSAQEGEWSESRGDSRRGGVEVVPAVAMAAVGG